MSINLPVAYVFFTMFIDTFTISPGKAKGTKTVKSSTRPTPSPLLPIP